MFVMELLGPNLEELLERCGHKFTLKTTLMLADQLVCMCCCFLEGCWSVGVYVSTTTGAAALCSTLPQMHGTIVQPVPPTHHVHTCTLYTHMHIPTPLPTPLHHTPTPHPYTKLSRLEYVHSKGFIHRDIKPENFMMGRSQHSNVVHIVDFGLAKRYMDPRTRRHIAYRDDKSLTGRGMH